MRKNWRKRLEQMRFNRYMVECELVMFVLFWFSCHGFNRYMVECESRYYTFNIDNPLGFNRYMVECELTLML